MGKSKIKTMIRQIVREEVAMAIHEVIEELKIPTQQLTTDLRRTIPTTKKKKIEKKHYSSNKVLNDALNETANSDWETLGGGTYTTENMGSILANKYSDVLNENGKVNADDMVASMGIDPNQVDDSVKNIFTKDYRSLMKKVDKKTKQKRGM